MIVPKFTIDQSIINNEIKVLNNILIQQRQLKETLALYLKKISDGIYNATDDQDATSLISCLDGIKKSFDNIKENINSLLDLRKYLENYSSNSHDTTYLEKYNEKYITLFEKISEDNVFYYSFMESLLKYMDVSFPSNKYSTSIKKSSTNISNKTNNQTALLNNLKLENNNENPINSSEATINSNNRKNSFIDEINEMNLPERTLFVSRKRYNAILPYSCNEIENYYSNNPNKYSSVKDVINKEYTISTRNMSFDGLERFKETYNLARNKSHLSFFKSLSLANELFFNTYVDPIVIKACKNIEELYIFLSCIDDNILHRFMCFNIIYNAQI